MRRLLCIIVCFVSICTTTWAQIDDNIVKETYLYSVKDRDSLYLDKYDLSNATDNATKPCIIFVFGGGFYKGTRDNAAYLPFFNFMAKNGYTVISIDYRLGLQRFKPEMVANPADVASLLVGSIKWAVEDLVDATNFTLKYADKWNIDKNKLITCGGSAGGITVLQTEYAICSRWDVANKLPKGFNYAGVMSFAGAIYCKKDAMTWQSQPAPLMMLHGDADKNVPYDRVELIEDGFYGSRYIASKLKEIKAPYFFIQYENAQHEIAQSPMYDNRNEILTFLEKLVSNKESLNIEAVVDQTDKPELDKNITILDLIKANFDLR